LSRHLIPKASGFVRPTNFAFVWFWHFEAIISRIYELDKTYIENKEGLQISESTIERGKAWQTQLRDSWTRQATNNLDPVENEKNETHQEEVVSVTDKE
jgi:RNA recognition motif-containing protein